MPTHLRDHLPRPIFIIGCNRTGSTLLFSNLATHPETWSLYIEGQAVFHRHYPVCPHEGERVTSAPDRRVAAAIVRELYSRANNKEVFRDTPALRHIPLKLMQKPVGALYKSRSIRLVEKTPANSLRVPLLHALFPDAKFLFLVRRGEDVVSSLMEGWKNWSRTPPGTKWRFDNWHYLRPPGWQSYINRTLQEICAFQWIQATLEAWRSLERLRNKDFMLLRHEDLIERPHENYRRILEFCELTPSSYFDRAVLGKMRERVYTTGGSAPRRDKWRQMHGAEIESVRHLLAPVNALFYD